MPNRRGGFTAILNAEVAKVSQRSQRKPGIEVRMFLCDLCVISATSAF